MGDSALPRSNLTLKKGAGSVGRNREHSSYITMCNRVIEKRTGPEGNLRTDGYEVFHDHFGKDASLKENWILVEC